MKNIYKIGKELFVTNDEEIKEGHWYLVELFNIEGKSKGLHIEKCTKLDDVWCNNFDVISTRHKNNCKKIILTTDQDLIKDGVQAVEEDFLNWFVKNPSCEEVEVDDEFLFGNLAYKIIIPNEECKIYTDGEYLVFEFPKEKPKQEPKQEQNKNRYSENELLTFGKSCFYKGFYKAEKDDANCYTAFREEIGNLFEQFKKK